MSRISLQTAIPYDAIAWSIPNGVCQMLLYHVICPSLCPSLYPVCLNSNVTRVLLSNMNIFVPAAPNTSSQLPTYKWFT